MNTTVENTFDTVMNISHTPSFTCPGCNESLRAEPLVDILYTFEICSCPHVPFPHLVEQLYHKECYNSRGETVDN